MRLAALAADLVCPVTRQTLSLVTLTEARERMAGGGPLQARPDVPSAPAVGETETVLLRADGAAAYPVVDGIPVLLAPEILRAPLAGASFDLEDPKYAEAYAEMEFYNSSGLSEARTLRAAGSLDSVPESESLQHLDRLSHRPAEERGDFPLPAKVWLHSRLDLQSEWDCYQHIGPVIGRRVLQLGGSGRAVQTLLLGGAAEGLLLTPMVGEAQAAIEVAKLIGVSERFQCLIAVAEEIPLRDNCVDVAFSAGCVHHMRTEIAFPEAARVLRSGGKFAAIEPWRAPLYALGTRLLGKREANPYCRPLTKSRVAPLFSAFSSARYTLHGTLSRYPMLGLQKFGLTVSLDSAWSIGRADDALSSWLALRRFGSGVALLATK